MHLIIYVYCVKAKQTVEKMFKNTQSSLSVAVRRQFYF